MLLWEENKENWALVHPEVSVASASQGCQIKIMSYKLLLGRGG